MTMTKVSAVPSGSSPSTPTSLSNSTRRISAQVKQKEAKNQKNQQIHPQAKRRLTLCQCVVLLLVIVQVACASLLFFQAHATSHDPSKSSHHPSKNSFFSNVSQSSLDEFLSSSFKRSTIGSRNAYVRSSNTSIDFSNPTVTAGSITINSSPASSITASTDTDAQGKTSISILQDEMDSSNFTLVPPLDSSFYIWNQQQKQQTDNQGQVVDLLPRWARVYFAWHTHQRAQLTPNNWKNFRYLVMRCAYHDGRCGGTADRIKTIPFVLYWAHKTRRILFIVWQRPCTLEGFLMPPAGGMDWTVPPWLMEQAPELLNGHYATTVKPLQRKVESNDRTVRCRVQSYNGGSLLYNEEIAPYLVETGMESRFISYQDLYHDLWRCIFTPTLLLQKLIHQHLADLGLEPGHYVSVHLRGLYARKDRGEKDLRRMTHNAIACASHLRQLFLVQQEQQGNKTTITETPPPSKNQKITDADIPIYFASDSTYATDFVVSSLSKRIYRAHQGVRVVALQRSYQPLHLEKDVNWTMRTCPNDYYDTFVDLYLLQLSTCVGYNVGGFGQWGSWMGYNAACHVQHANRARSLPCKWAQRDEYTNKDENKKTLLQLRSSMENDDNENSNSNKTSLLTWKHVMHRILHQPIFLLPKKDNNSTMEQENDNVVLTEATNDTNKDAESTTENTINSSSLQLPQPLPQQPESKATEAPTHAVPMTFRVPWQNSTTMPLWMKEYFAWHAAMRPVVEQPREVFDTSNATSSSIQYLIMVCTRDISHCGGTADRLKPLPFMLYMAARHKRYLLIYWTKPYALQEFMVPPQSPDGEGGLDWTVPSWIEEAFFSPKRRRRIVPVSSMTRLQDTLAATLSPPQFISTKFQSHTHGAEHYNAGINSTLTHSTSLASQSLWNEDAVAMKIIQQATPMFSSSSSNPAHPLSSTLTPFESVFADVFRNVFVLAEPIRRLYWQTMEALHLDEGKFVAAHLRVLYGRTERPESQTRTLVYNALQCASGMRTSSQHGIYVAADQGFATRLAHEYGLQHDRPIQTHLKIVTAKENNNTADNLLQQEPLHLDHDFSNTTLPPPSHFYPTFHDLWMLGSSYCMVYNMGGFGTLGQLLGFNASCGLRHFGKRVLHACPKWRNNNTEE